jgi:hypothetical protein
VTDLRDQPDATGDRESLQPDLGRKLANLPPGHPSSVEDHAPDGPDRTDEAPDGCARDPSGLDRDPEADQRDYWSEVPRFRQELADHLRRWPAETRPPVDRSRDPAGSWRGDGNQYLSPAQHAEANAVIAEVRSSEETVSGHMRDIERENKTGGSLYGWEFRLKQDDRLKEKIAEKVEHQPDRTVGEAMQDVNDAIRYTFCLDSANYVAGYHDITSRLEGCGNRMFYSKNHWRDDPEYKGINTRWLMTDGQRFEVQFHTLESFHAKQDITHQSYERLRSPMTNDYERGALRDFQMEVSSWIPVPEGTAEVTDYNEDNN